MDGRSCGHQRRLAAGCFFRSGAVCSGNAHAHTYTNCDTDCYDTSKSNTNSHSESYTSSAGSAYASTAPVAANGIVRIGWNAQQLFAPRREFNGRDESPNVTSRFAVFLERSFQRLNHERICGG